SRDGEARETARREQRLAVALRDRKRRSGAAAQAPEHVQQRKREQNGCIDDSDVSHARSRAITRMTSSRRERKPIFSYSLRAPAFSFMTCRYGVSPRASSRRIRC